MMTYKESVINNSNKMEICYLEMKNSLEFLEKGIKPLDNHLWLYSKQLNKEYYKIRGKEIKEFFTPWKNFPIITTC